MRAPKQLEKSIEQAVVKWAKDRGLYPVKLNGMGKRSLPDRMFLGKYAGKGKVVFIEFKRPSGKLTPLQAHTHREWASLGQEVHVVDNVEVAKIVLSARFDLK